MSKQSKRQSTGGTLAELLATQREQAEAYLAAHPRKKGGGTVRDTDRLYALPEGTSGPIADRADLSCLGVTADGVYCYLKTYKSGTTFKKKVTADGAQFDSWRQARLHWSKVAKAAR